MLSFIPARCWIAPEMPTAMYRSGATILPVCPICDGKVVGRIYTLGIGMNSNLHVIGDHSSINSCSAGTKSSSKLVSKGVKPKENDVTNVKNSTHA